MIDVDNITHLLDDGKEYKRAMWRVDVIAVHRIWFDDWPEDLMAAPIDIARRFIEDPAIRKYTGGEIPYPLLIDKDGGVTQCLTLGDTGRHASVWNDEALGVGVIGDFRKRPPTPIQYSALTELLADLCVAYDIDPLGQTWGNGHKVFALAGHDELPGGSRDPSKKCPGKFLNMSQLRSEAARLIPASAQGRLMAAGIIP